VLQVKRLGGGFGGKETRAAILGASIAVAAQKVKQPVNIMMDRDEDMRTSGGRHPFFGKYRAAARRSDKRLLALQADLYATFLY